MNYFWKSIGWIWSRKLFFFTILASTLFFFIWMFPFTDLGHVVTSQVSMATNNQVYVQFKTLDIHLIPQPAISATELSVETSLPPLQASEAKFTPSLFGFLFATPTLIKAMRGDPEAGRAALGKLGASISARGLMGGDMDLSFGPGAKSERGSERSRFQLNIDKLSLKEARAWGELPVKMDGSLSASTDIQFSPDFVDQPEGEYHLHIAKFQIPAGTVQVPFGDALMPVNLPGITLENVVLRGRLTGGRLFIEEGSFGKEKDPIYGRLKGNLSLRLQPMGASVTPVTGPYDLTIEMTTTQMIEKELGFAFLLLGPGKSPTPGGGAHYLFKAQGQGLGMAYVPTITRAGSF